MKKYLLFVIAACVVLLDQLTKWLVSASMQLSNSFPVIKNVLHITSVHNYGAGFGILQNQQWLLAWVSIIAIGIIMYYYDKIPVKTSYIIFIGLILGGIIGNLIDRIALGYVVDFIDFRVFPVFNVADTCLCTGTIGLIIWGWKK